MASVGANNTSNTSSKDDYLVSTDGSFCSDLESTDRTEGQSSVNCLVDRLLDTSSSVPTTANQKTSSDGGAKDACPPVFRCSAANSSSSVGTVPEKLNPGAKRISTIEGFSGIRLYEREQLRKGRDYRTDIY